MTDTLSFRARSAADPPSNFAAVTPNDSADLTYTTSCIYCASAGLVYVDGQETGTNVPLPVAAGCNPGRFTRIYATGLTVTGTIVAGW